MKEIRIIVKSFNKQTKQKLKQNHKSLKKLCTKKSTKQLQLC